MTNNQVAAGGAGAETSAPDACGGFRELGATINFSVSGRQAAHKVWGAPLDQSGCCKPIDLA